MITENRRTPFTLPPEYDETVILPRIYRERMPSTRYLEDLHRPDGVHHYLVTEPHRDYRLSKELLIAVSVAMFLVLLMAAVLLMPVIAGLRWG